MFIGTSSSEVIALSIEGTNSQIEAITRHNKKWDARFELNNKVVHLIKWKRKRIDSAHCALYFPLNGFNTVFQNNFGAVSKDLTFLTGSLKANEVLTPLITNGIKVKVLTSDDEFTLKKSSIILSKKKQ